MCVCNQYGRRGEGERLVAYGSHLKWWSVFLSDQSDRERLLGVWEQVQPVQSAAEFQPDCLVVVSGFETGTSDFVGSGFAYVDDLLDRATSLDSRIRGPAAVLAGIDGDARHKAGGAKRVVTCKAALLPYDPADLRGYASAALAGQTRRSTRMLTARSQARRSKR